MSFATQTRGVVSTPDVELPPFPMLDHDLTSESIESRWLVWGRSAFVVAVTLVLLTLGVANVTLYSRWHEVEDGVQWDARPEGVTAVEIADGSAAAVWGRLRGDVVVAVEGVP